MAELVVPWLMVLEDHGSNPWCDKDRFCDQLFVPSGFLLISWSVVDSSVGRALAFHHEGTRFKSRGRTFVGFVIDL